ncbi:MAG: restriction endonuclease, partial [bacterium]|nr:restriction endonuclease [bacterium]
FSTTAGYQLDDLQFDIRMKVKTGPLRSYVLVECKKWARPVGQREVREFISKVEHAKKAERLPYRAIMVSHLGFRDQAHKIAEPDFVELLTLRELMLSLVDLRPNLAAAIAGFEGTELQRLYVEQDVVFQSAIRPGAEVEAAALTPAVCAWLERGGASPQAPMTKPSRSGTPTTDD